MLSLSHDETNTIEATIDRRLGEQGNSIRNRAAFGALIKLVPHFGESLHHALTAGDDAIRDEKIAMQLDYLCGLVQRIDAVITEVLEAAESKGLPIVEISGKVSVRARNVEHVTGVEIAGDRAATIQPGTVITLDVTNAASATGLKI